MKVLNMDGIENYISEVLRIKRWKNFLQANAVWYLFLLFIVLLSFTFELFNFTLTIDDEFHASLEEAHPAWISQGRWGMYFLSKMLFPNPIIPFSVLFLGLVFSALAYDIVTRIFFPRRTIAEYLCAPLFIACPTFYFVYNFNTLSYGVGIGFFITAVSFYGFIKSSGWQRYLWSALTAFSIAIYQSFLFWIIVLFLFYLLKDFFEKSDLPFRSCLKKIFRFGVYLCIAVFLYYLTSKIIYAVYHVKLDQYIQSYWDDGILTWKYWEKTLPDIIRLMKNTYLGGKKVYVFPIYSLQFLFPLSFLLVIFSLVKKQQKIFVKILGAILLFLTPIVPFGLNFFTGNRMPIRALVAVPLVFAVFTLFALKYSRRLFHFIFVPLIVIVGFRFTVINNQYAFADQLSWHADRDFSVRILSRIDDIFEKLPEKDKKEVWPIMFVGAPQRNSNDIPVFLEKEAVGASFYSWTANDVIYRIYAFLRTMRVNDFQTASLAQQKEIVEYANTMPSWPAKDSVDVYRGVLIVKFGPYKKWQLEKICKENSAMMCKITYQPSDDGIRGATDDELRDQCRKNNLVFTLSHGDDITLFPSEKVQKINDDTFIYNVPDFGSQLIFPKFPDEISGKKTYLIRMNVEVEKESELFMFYRRKKDDNYSADREIHFALHKGENDLAIIIPGRLLANPLRMDPSVAGKIAIHYFNIYRVDTED